MKKTLLTAILICASTLAAQAQYQLPNSGFEGDWDEVSNSHNRSGKEPAHWNSFISGTGSLTSMASYDQLEESDDVRPGSTGTKSVKIKDRKVLFSIIAQGNLTTGRINMGSMSAADAKGNYNYTQTDDNNFNQPFTGKPDAMHVWVKFVSSKDNFRAKANTILHEAGYYQDPINADKETAKRVAIAENLDIAPSNEWQELTIPFAYDDASLTPAYALVSFASNSTPGKGANGNYMLIDDIEYIYNSELTKATFGDIVIESPSVGEPIAVDAVYDESVEPVFATNAVAATVEKAWDATSNILTVTVSGNDISENPDNKHVYEFKFNAPVAEPEDIAYTNSLLVNSAAVGTGWELTEKKDIHLVHYPDEDKYDFILKDFAFGGGAIVIDEIKVEDLQRTEAEGQETFTKKGAIVNVPLGGEILPLPADVEAVVKDGKMTASISISLGESKIDVQFAPLYRIAGSESLADPATTGLQNIVLERTFAKGWTTICLPFVFDKAFGSLGEQPMLRELSSVEKNALNFTEPETIEANKPYLVCFDNETAQPVYFMASIEALQPATIEKGEFSFTGIYDALTSPAGKYKLNADNETLTIEALDEAATLAPTEAYFTTTSENALPSYIVMIDGQATGINGIEVPFNASSNAIYTVDGTRLDNTTLDTLPKGVYIVNGKKVVK